MPVRRRFGRRRFFRRRRRMMRRRVVKRIIRPRYYNFKRSCELDNLAVAAGAANVVAKYSFYLGQLPGASEFSTLFDQYRIMAIKVTFYPPYNVGYTSGTSSSMPIGEFYSAVDTDGGGPTTPVLSDLLQYQRLKRTYFNKPHVSYFRPNSYQFGVQDGATSYGGYLSVPRRAWIDISVLTCRYYGLLVGWSQSVPALTQNMSIRVTATYYFQCRGVR